MNTEDHHSRGEVVELRLCSGGVLHLLVGPAWRVHYAFASAMALWLPLLILNLLSHSGPALESFWSDWAIHVRLLISTPVLILAEAPVCERTKRAIEFLKEYELIDANDRQTLHQTVETVNRWESYLWPEFASILFFFGLSFYYEPESAGRAWHSLSPWAYSWLRHLALPIFQTLIARWILRLALWSWCLYRISRCQLTIHPHHPDGAGGLAFLTWAQQPFAIVAFALASILTANVRQSIIARALPADAFYKPSLIFAVTAFALFLGPLIFFSRQLRLSKLDWVLRLSRFSDFCSHQFEQKWVLHPFSRRGVPSPLEGADISSMADLIFAQEHADRMRILLVDKRTLLLFTGASLAPLVPVYLSDYGLAPLIAVLKKVVA